jgi:hypothetical protein
MSMDISLNPLEATTSSASNPQVTQFSTTGYSSSPLCNSIAEEVPTLIHSSKLTFWKRIKNASPFEMPFSFKKKKTVSTNFISSQTTQDLTLAPELVLTAQAVVDPSQDLALAQDLAATPDGSRN